MRPSIGYCIHEYMYVNHARNPLPIENVGEMIHPLYSLFIVCSNEVPCPFPKGDNYEIVKVH